MKTTAGEWLPIAKNVADRMMRSAILETCRASFMMANKKAPGDVKRRLADRHQALLYEVMAQKYNASGDQLEKMANAAVRMMLLALRDETFSPILSMTWYRAITITRWADHDMSSARDEVVRTGDDAAIGPRETERRYKEAIARLGPTQKSDANGGTDSGHRLTFAMLEANEYAGLEAILAHFEGFGFGRYVCHVIAKELPRLATETRFADIQTITRIVNASGVTSSYLKPTAQFLMRHTITSHHATRMALDKLGFVKTYPKNSEQFTADADTILPKRKFHFTKDVIAWQQHPKWSRFTQRAAAEQGRALFKRDIYAWIMATEENGDPDNHPLNFIEYDRRYGHRNILFLLGGPTQ